MNTENIDLVTITLSKGNGQSTQLPNSIYRVDHYPGAMLSENTRHAGGSVKIKDKGDSVLVTCGPDCAIECFADHSWHIIADSCDGDLHIDVWHRPHGYPLWYGREKPSAPTRHSITIDTIGQET